MNVDAVDSLLWLFHLDKALQSDYAGADKWKRREIVRQLMKKSTEVALLVQKDFAEKGLEIHPTPIGISYEVLPTFKS